MPNTYLKFHHVNLCVNSTVASVRAELRHDFHCFLTKAKPTKSYFRIFLHPTSEREEWRLLFKIRDTGIFWPQSGERRVSFFGRAWVAYHYSRGARIYCDDPVVAYEVLYLVILSYLGERLDEKAVHRIHGLGLDLGREAVLLLGASGTGKSTLAMQILGGEKIKLLSDDTPLVSHRRGRAEVHSFPQRIATKELPRLPARYVRRFKRVNYGEKFVVGGGYLDRHVGDKNRLRWMLLMKRNGKKQSSIVPVSSRHAIWPVLKWMVIGFETPQIWQLYVRLSPREVLKKLGILKSRLEVGVSLIQHTRIAAFTLSEDPKESAKCFQSWQMTMSPSP